MRLWEAACLGLARIWERGSRYPTSKSQFRNWTPNLTAIQELTPPRVGCFRGSALTALSNRRTQMKTMFLTLAAVLGLARCTPSLIPAAHASKVQRMLRQSQAPG